MLQSGEADIGVATETLAAVPELVTFRFHTRRHALILPKDHALTQLDKLTLEQIAEWPLITYHEGFTGRERVDQAFAAAGVAPDIVMSALDDDVIKTYVTLGVGVGTVASMAFDPMWRGRYLRSYAYRFIELCSPGLKESAIRTALSPPQEAEFDV
jgi:LysR family transcriptional regulator, cys regulon transcriptional activator